MKTDKTLILEGLNIEKVRQCTYSLLVPLFNEFQYKNQIMNIEAIKQQLEKDLHINFSGKLYYCKKEVSFINWGTLTLSGRVIAKFKHHKKDFEINVMLLTN